MYGIYANIWGILMVNVTIYGIHGSYEYGLYEISDSVFFLVKYGSYGFGISFFEWSMGIHSMMDIYLFLEYLTNDMINYPQQVGLSFMIAIDSSFLVFVYG